LVDIEILGWLRLAVSVALGLCVGSFLNVVILRVPKGRSIIRPFSHCQSCKKAIRWSDNLPVLSYFLLGGRCRHCRKKISIQYPIIEALTALLFAADTVRFPNASLAQLLIRDWPFLATLVAITFIDLRHRIIPDVLSLGGLVWGMGTYWLVPNWSWKQTVLGAFLGFALFYSLAWFYLRVRRRVGLGGGDVKLLAMLGAYIGPSGVLATICFSSILGSVVGLAWAKFLNRKRVLEFAIPFGPFLVVGALFYYFLGDFIWYLYLNQI
jgi:leader peptidase (prepilin peptidase)/N-methyltransferase